MEFSFLIKAASEEYYFYMFFLSLRNRITLVFFPSRWGALGNCGVSSYFLLITFGLYMKTQRTLCWRCLARKWAVLIWTLVIPTSGLICLSSASIFWVELQAVPYLPTKITRSKLQKAKWPLNDSKDITLYFYKGITSYFCTLDPVNLLESKQKSAGIEPVFLPKSTVIGPIFKINFKNVLFFITA